MAASFIEMIRAQALAGPVPEKRVVMEWRAGNRKRKTAASATPAASISDLDNASSSSLLDHDANKVTIGERGRKPSEAINGGPHPDISPPASLRLWRWWFIPVLLFAVLPFSHSAIVTAIALFPWATPDNEASAIKVVEWLYAILHFVQGVYAIAVGKGVKEAMEKFDEATKLKV